mgnify:CR=1 FL=1
MTVWANPSITDVPAFTLVSWAVYEVQLGPDAPVTRHVVGEVGYGGEGQVSSPIVAFDPATARFLTRSGRVYRVTAACGNLGVQGDYVWARWLANWRSHVPPRDVTAEVAQEIAKAHGELSYRELRMRWGREQRGERRKA